jgi:Short-chain alcohol dehydrogenase of unknown specificity
MRFDLYLSGLRAVVTGGTLGLGAAVVRTLAQAGARVATSARSLPRHPAEGVTYVAADLSTAEGTRHFSETVLKQWGSVDILINVLGGSKTPGGGFAAISDEHWFAELNLNLMPAVRMDRALLPGMLDQGSGVIIHVSSIQRVLPLPESTTAYAAAKAALSTYSKALAREVTPQGSSRAQRCTWLDRNRGFGSICAAYGCACRHRLRGRQKNHHGVAGRYSRRTASETR